MTEARKRSLEQIVHEAQTLPPGEQLRYIRDACASDDAMYASAVSQMQSRQIWSDLDDEPGSGLHELPADPAGQLIGPYRLVRSLGQGGMGEVFLAERTDEYHQQVAVKLVRRGLLSRQLQGRLRQERQILASLDHPNIARLYDGGTTSDGTPYIVMEYVDGEPVDAYCNKRGLTIEQRLRLFVTVCSAVHRAHQNLIVHRDLKPSNILVTPEGVAKLLDFGIAKLLDDREMMHTLAVTQADYRVMTPDHASPEQIRGELISTASDIYVLGVLLYELLSGCKPMVLKGNRLAELERAICEDQPPPLAAVASGAAGISASDALAIADQRSTTVAKLRRELGGDLDNIVMMAMRKEPERRYSSVEQFAADIERFLDGLPVLARANSWGYRAGKFVRRHAFGVTLSAAFLVSLIGFAVAIYAQSQRIRVERDVAQSERQRAEDERERAEAVSAFLIGSFKSADPFSPGGGSKVTAEQILKNGAARITRELRDQPALQATVLDTIGSAYLGLGLPNDAMPLIEQGLSVRRSVFGADSTDVARSLYSLNRVYEKKGDLDQAEKLARESLDINRKRTGAESIETAGSLCRLGVIEQEQGQLTEAEKLFNSCLRIRIVRLGEHHPEVTVPLDNLARIEWARNDTATAEKLLRQAVEIDRLRPGGGEEDPQSLRHLHRLAMVIYDRGDVAAAEPLFRRSVELHRKVLTPEHPETIDAMSSFGSFLMETGRLDEAQVILQDVLDIDRRRREPDHAYVGNDLQNLGRLAFRKGEYARAEKYNEEALRIYRVRQLRPGHDLIASTLTMLGRAKLELGQPAEAAATLQQAVDSWRLEYGEQSPGYALARASLGRAWALQKKFAEAEPALLDSYPILTRSSRGVDQEVASVVRRWIEDLYRAMGRPEAAQNYFSRQQPAPSTP